MSRKNRSGGPRKAQGPEKDLPQKESPKETAVQGRVLSRRNLLKAGAVGLLGLTGVGYWAATRARDKNVFDEKSGDGSKTIDCYKQIHHGDELALIMQRQPALIEYFINHQRGILQHLTEKLLQDAQTVYLLEGCNPYMQRQMRANRDFSQAVRKLGDALDTDPGKVIEACIRASQQATASEFAEVLVTSQATAQFVIRKARPNTRVFGTEPNQDVFVLWTDFINNEVRVLATAQKDGTLTDQMLDDASVRINARKNEEVLIRHAYMRDTLRDELRGGGSAQVVLGAAHFKSGTGSVTAPVDNPIEDYLLQVPDTRVRVVEEAHFTRVRDGIRSARQVRQVGQIDARTLRKLIERENKR